MKGSWKLGGECYPMPFLKFTQEKDIAKLYVLENAVRAYVLYSIDGK